MRTAQPQETHGGILTGGCHLIYNDIQGPKQAVNIICNQQTHKHGRPVILKRSSFSPSFKPQWDILGKVCTSSQTGGG